MTNLFHKRRARGRRRADGDDGPVDPRDLPGGGLAVVDTDRQVIHSAPAAVTSSVRYLLARLQLNDAAGIPARLALTSCVRGEGVTFVTRTLAAVAAYDLKRRVCLVDLNWWGNPGATPISGRPGVADVVSGHANLDDILVPTADPGLWLVPPGQISVASRPVLAKDPALAKVLDQLSAQFDHLILELPPVLITSESLTMARLSDAVALVVRQGATTESQVRDAIAELRSVVLLGVILNRYSTRVPRRISSMLST